MLAGPKILIEGASGSGKSYSIGTLVEWAQRNQRRVHILYTENSFETVLKYFAGKSLPECLHWHVIRSPVTPLNALIDAADLSGRLSYEALTKMGDKDRGANNPWLKILTALADMPDDRTGRKFGNISSWGPDMILVVDSLSEAASAAFRMVVGAKPVASQPEYLVAQTNLINWLRYITQSLTCTLVLTAHVQRLTNEVTGTTQLMTKAIGKALSDEIPQLFSEVIYSLREGSNWYWDTAAPNVDSKTRYLPIASKLKPDFAQIMDKWLALATSIKPQGDTK